MDFNTTIDIIIKDLREAREIIDDLKQYPGVPQIQVELAKSKCKSAEDIIALLKTMKLNFQPPENTVVEEVERVEKEEDKVSKAPESVSQADLFEISDEDESESPPPSIRSEMNTENINPPENGKPLPEADAVIETKSKKKSTESNIVADRFSGMSNIFNEQLGNIKSDGDISAVLKSRPVTNLTEAIGINEKFLYLREIFNGNQLLYNEAIAKLNRVDNLADAKAIIMSYTGEGEEDEAVKQLLDLVKRKLPANE